jgi:tRNA (Thr-GGU) A37 N-methylase
VRFCRVPHASAPFADAWELHRVTVRALAKSRLRIGPMEAIGGTLVVDIKPALSGVPDF